MRSLKTMPASCSLFYGASAPLRVIVVLVGRVHLVMRQLVQPWHGGRGRLPFTPIRDLPDHLIIRLAFRHTKEAKPVERVCATHAGVRFRSMASRVNRP